MIKLPPPRILFTTGLLSLILLALIGSHHKVDYRSHLESIYSTQPHSNTYAGGILASEPGWKILEEIKLTKFLAHAPGFSVIENLYYQNGAYVFITDQPWAIPSQEHTAHYSTDGRIPVPPEFEATRVYAIRNSALSPQVEEKNQMGISTNLDEAIRLSQSAVDLPSPMIISNDDKFVNHYYHWIGEIFLGCWRIWSHYAWASGKSLPPIRVVSFAKQWFKQEAPEDARNDASWQDSAGANEWFTNKFFPDVRIESQATWHERKASGELYRIPMAILGDRRAGHSGPSAAWKPFGDVFRLPVAPDWILTLRDRLLKGYKGPVSLKKGRKPLLAYLHRQESGRRLNHDDHAKLMTALEGLQEEELVDYELLHFTKDMAFEDQVATISRVDILVSVHGNGLTHLIWMNSGAGKAVFEMQPASCTVTDYSPLAQAANIRHYLTHETTMCLPEDCPGRGCDESGGINTPDIRIDPEIITSEIRKILQE